MENEIGKQNLSKIALKNSSYSFASILILKLGGLIFTILIARLLLPELFGLYSLVFSIVAIFLVFTDLGINESFLRYLSESLGNKDNKKARSYFHYFIKLKSYLVLLVIIILLLTARFLAYNIYEEPLLFYPLIFSCFFILLESFKNFFGHIFFATKNIKPTTFLELLHQIIRISFSIFAISLFSIPYKITGLFLAFALAGLIHFLLLLLLLYKDDKEKLIGEKISLDKTRIWKFIKFMGIASLTLVFFGSIDILMLGKFVDLQYLGYYRAALSLIIAIASFFSLSGVLLPIFTQINKKRFKRGFQKTFRYLMFFAIPATTGVILISKYIIFAVYGKEYLLATPVLYTLSLLVLTSPLISLYTIIFESKEKSKIIAKAVFISLIINIFLNYVMIKYLLNFSQESVIIGVGVSTVISRSILLGILITNAKTKFNLKIKGLVIGKPIFATIIMSIFLITFNYLIDLNIFLGLLEIILGAIIYFTTLYLIKSFTIEDWILIKNLNLKNYFKK